MNTKLTDKEAIYKVIKYILEKRGETGGLKLHRLLYYCQAWSLVWDEKPLFDEEIQAWASGPVIPFIYQNHKSAFKITAQESWLSDIKINLDIDQKSTIDAVLKVYGAKSCGELGRLTNREEPFRDARKDMPLGERGHQVITYSSMAEFYSGTMV